MSTKRSYILIETSRIVYLCMTFYWTAADVKRLYATFVFKLNNKEITAPPKKAFTCSKNTKNENNE